MWALDKVNNDHEVLIAGARRYATHCRSQETPQRYIAQAHRWLADERWLDEYPEPPTPPNMDAEIKLWAATIEKTGRPLVTVSDHQARILVSKGWLSRAQALKAGYDI